MTELRHPGPPMMRTWRVLGSIGPLFSDSGLKNWELLLGRETLLAPPLGIGLSIMAGGVGGTWRWPGHRSARRTVCSPGRLGQRAAHRRCGGRFLASLSHRRVGIHRAAAMLVGRRSARAATWMQRTGLFARRPLADRAGASPPACLLPRSLQGTKPRKALVLVHLPLIDGRRPSRQQLNLLQN